MLTTTALLALFIGLQARPALGHSVLTSISIAGKVYPGWSDGLNLPSPDKKSIQRKIDADGWILYNYPNMATAEDKQAAQYDGTNPVEVAEANAGDEIVVEWARWWNDNHPGPITVYMARCENDCVGEDAKNMEWFKTHEWGFDPSRKPTDQWASEQMFNNGKKVTFSLPTTLPGGHYIVRNEIIALHSVGRGPEYYPRAFQINLKSDGTEEPSPKGKFPDIYMQETTRNAHAKYFNNNDGGETCKPIALGYQIPGLEVIKGGVSEHANNLEAAKAAGCTNLGSAAGGSPAPAGASGSANPGASPVTGTLSASGSAATINPSVLAKGPEPSSGSPAPESPPPSTPNTSGGGNCADEMMACFAQNEGKQQEQANCQVTYNTCAQAALARKRHVQRKVARRF